jgi:hypothetical protein
MWSWVLFDTSEKKITANESGARQPCDRARRPSHAGHKLPVATDRYRKRYLS